MLFLLLACSGPNEETLVDELRVMSIVVEPPEAAPGATVAVDARIADPLAESPQVMLWSCTNLGDGCAEAAEPSQGVTVGPPVDGQLTASRTVSEMLLPIVQDGTTVLPVFLWALTCAPGLCPVIDLAATAPAVGSAEAKTLSTFLADPFSAMEDLRLEHTSLAFTQLKVSTRATPVQNPTLSPQFETVTVKAEGSVDLVFYVTDPGDFTAYGYTTAGGFDAPEYANEDGVVTLTWFGPAEAGEADIWVVVNNDTGGTAVWQGKGTVMAP